MNYFIENYLKNLKIEEVNEFAIKNNVYLSRNELEFVYEFIKNNGSKTLEAKSINLELYQSKFTPENYEKISKLLDIYLTKYKNYL